MEYKDYYATLGVPKTAQQADIKKAFRARARQHHPDVNKGDAAAERRFKDLSEAYEVLGDPTKRKAYDELGANWEMYERAGAAGAPRSAGGPFASGAGARTGPGGIRFEYRGSQEDLSGFSDFFRTFFGGGLGDRFGGSRERGAGNGRTSRRATRSAEDIDLEELFAGLEMEGANTPGGGRAASAAVRDDAQGEAEVSLEEAFRGTARLVQVGDRRLEVRIPPGVQSGQRIRLTGKAGTGPDAGDLYLRVVVPEHPIYTRKGADLHRELPVTLAEALLGAEVPVPTITGRVLLRIPSETQNGRAFRLAGQGMPRFRGEGRGDLYVKVRVVLPTGLDEEARRRAQAFAEAARQPDPRTT